MPTHPPHHAASEEDQTAPNPKRQKMTARSKNLTNQLKLRLSYARLKVDHGWQKQSFHEVENLFFHVRHQQKIAESKAAVKEPKRMTFEFQIQTRDEDSEAQELPVQPQKGPLLIEQYTGPDRQNSAEKGKAVAQSGQLGQPHGSTSTMEGTITRNEASQSLPGTSSFSVSATPLPVRPPVQTGIPVVDVSASILDPALFMSAQANVNVNDPQAAQAFPGNLNGVSYEHSQTAEPDSCDNFTYEPVWSIHGDQPPIRWT